MKKRIIYALLLSLNISLVGCSNSSTTNATPTEPEEITTTDTTVVVSENDTVEEPDTNVETDEEITARKVSEGIEIIYTDSDSALALFEEAAEMGNEDAMFLAGYTYDWVYGMYNRPDFEKAREYYEMVEDTNPYAMICSYFNYKYGQGADINEDKASNYSDKALQLIDKNNIDELEYANIAYNIYASYYYDIENYSIAVDLYKSAADLGNPNAMNNLGNCYYKGNGVEQDYSIAVDFYKNAADLGNPNAMNNLGGCYYYGNGVSQSVSQAYKWWENAYDLNYYEGARNIGNYFYINQRNYSKAIEWYEKALVINDQDSDSLHNIGMCYQMLEDYLSAEEYFKKSLEVDEDPMTMRCLGSLYYEDLNNPDAAKEWWTKAAELGEEKAQEYLDKYF